MINKFQETKNASLSRKSNELHMKSRPNNIPVFDIKYSSVTQ